MTDPMSHTELLRSYIISNFCTNNVNTTLSLFVQANFHIYSLLTQHELILHLKQSSIP